MMFLFLIVALSPYASSAFALSKLTTLLALNENYPCCRRSGIFITQINKRRSQVSRNHLPSLSNKSRDVNDNSDSDTFDFDDELSEESRKRFERITKEFLADADTDFPSAMPRNPFQSNNSKDKLARRGKESLYSDDELMALLSIHNELNDELNDDVTSDGDRKYEQRIEEEEEESFSLHDLVMQTVGDDSKTTNDHEKNTSGGVNNVDSFTLDEATKQKMNQIKAIASDLDGTILTKRQTIHPRTRMAIKRAVDLTGGSNGKNNDADNEESKSDSNNLDYFFLATGKSRKGAIDSLSSASIEIGSLVEDNCPGVFLQGLFCVDQFGNTIFEKKLNHEAIDAAERLVTETGVSIVAYDGDNLYTTEQSDIVIHLHEHYGEPLPVLLPPNNDDDQNSAKVRKLSSHQPSMHKLLIMDDDTKKLEDEVRPKLEDLASRYDACVTQALPTMLELLPRDCSKAFGVQKLCEALSINVADELMAIGDAENDAGMLEAACIGVAVGNACPRARDSADFVLNESNDEGGAGVAIETFVLSLK